MKRSFRDPATNVLKAWGYMATNAPGDVGQDEADTFALTPGLWQWDGAEWIAYTPPPIPDVASFLVDLYGTVFGASFATVDTVLKASPSFAQLQTQLESANWTAAAGIILYAQAVTAITAPQYAAIKAAATARHIPVTLP